MESKRTEMLPALREACLLCRMCDLGWHVAERAGESLSPHVFSNMRYSKWMIVGQNPGWNELQKQTPFVGQSGVNFDREINKHGVSRDEFYITNAVKCFSEGNSKPTNSVVDTCSSFLKIEMAVMRPKLVIALGSLAYGCLCDGQFSQNVGKICVSQKFGVKVFATYHPSPLNLNIESRRKQFEHDIAILCGVIKRAKQQP